MHTDPVKGFKLKWERSGDNNQLKKMAVSVMISLAQVS